MVRQSIIAWVLSVCLSQLVYAEDAKTSAELDKVESGIDNVKQAMQQLAQQEQDLQNQLAAIEQHYGDIAATLKTLQLQIDHKQQSLELIRQDRVQYQTEISQLSLELASQVRAAYAMGQQEKLKLLLSQQDPALSSRMMVYFTYINKERLRKLKGMEAAVEHLEQLDRQKQTETQLLEQDLVRKQSEQSALDADRRQRSELLVKLGNDFSSREQQLNQLQESKDRLESLMSSLPITDEEMAIEPDQLAAPPDNTTEDADTNLDFAALKGMLPWPVQGNLVQKFGSPRLSGVWDGVLINAEEGQDIKAVARGKVVYAAQLQGYGLLTIIDHGQGFKTLYAFSQSLYKKTGDNVAAGEVIASVGLSGGRSEAELYFEVRKQGVPVDPLDWCIQ
ncbi:MAG: peptidoglycan DD-metalloendopeptidase family protein [Methylococcaceae bacterium]|nr:peptidoglycan DD-metalloendopeptidase family protein [Methylococcaceae bacterium]